MMLKLEGVIIFENLMLYQILVVIIAILAILLAFDRFHRKTSLQTFILWIVLWAILAIFAVIPESSSFLARIIGIGRGLDLILIFGIIGSYYLIFRVYLKLEKIDQNITELVRKISMDKELNYELELEKDNED